MVDVGGGEPPTFPVSPGRFRQRREQGLASVGGRGGARTPDLLVANEALSQLSYTPIGV